MTRSGRQWRRNGRLRGDKEKKESGEGELREQKNAYEGEGVTRERHGAELTGAK